MHKCKTVISTAPATHRPMVHYGQIIMITISSITWYYITLHYITCGNL